MSLFRRRKSEDHEHRIHRLEALAEEGEEVTDVWAEMIERRVGELEHELAVYRDAYVAERRPSS